MVGSFGQGVGGERLNTLKGMIQNPDVQDKLGRLSRLAPSRQQDGHQQAWSHQSGIQTELALDGLLGSLEIAFRAVCHGQHPPTLAKLSFNMVLQ